MKSIIKSTLAAIALSAAAVTGAYAADVSDQKYVMVVPISGHPFWVPIRQGAQRINPPMHLILRPSPKGYDTIPARIADRSHQFRPCRAGHRG